MQICKNLNINIYATKYVKHNNAGDILFLDSAIYLHSASEYFQGFRWLSWNNCRDCGGVGDRKNQGSHCRDIKKIRKKL